MRCFSTLVVCALVISVAGIALADDSVLTKFWEEQRSAEQPGRMATQGPSTKALVGIEFGTVSRELLAKAEPDECFTEIGLGPTPLPCTGEARPKTNQGYVWGMVDVGDDVWFGTVANTQCIVAGTMIGQALGAPLPPIETNSWVCEFGAPGWNPVGDQRPPMLYAYHTATDTLEDLTVGMGADLVELAKVVGIRAAGSQDGVVLFAGPTVEGDVHMFAFQTDGTYIGASEFPDWIETRRFANLNGELYLGIGVGPIAPNPPGGMVVRWDGDAADPFDFVPVTYLPGEQVAEIAEHNGRLAAGTWAIPQVAGPLGESSGVWISPDPVDGVVDLADGPWTKFWEISDYEPNQVNSLVTGVGAMASYGGNLYWGTMHPPFLAMAAHYGFYEATFYEGVAGQGYYEEFLLAAFLGTHRATSLWMGSNLGDTNDVDMLYGLPALPYFDPGTDPIPPDPVIEDYWTIVDTGWEPVWGISGFGNLFNNYTWSMTVNNGRLWVGTMDMLYLLVDAGAAFLEGILESQGLTVEDAVAQLIALGYLDSTMLEALEALGSEDIGITAGADLYYFPAPDAPAFPESLSGIDNLTSYGVRNMRSVGGSIYAGMANPMNLMTDTSDDYPEGGWELIKLDDEEPNTPVGESVTVRLEDGSEITLCDVVFPGYTVGMHLPLGGFPIPLPPPPEGFRFASDLMMVGTSANSMGCGPDAMASICMPNPTYNAGLFQLQIVEDPVAGSIPMWVEITASREDGMLCGAIDLSAQPLLWELGYNGYMGLVTVIEQLAFEEVPDAGPLGRALLVILIGIAAVIVIRMKLG